MLPWGVLESHWDYLDSSHELCEKQKWAGVKVEAVRKVHCIFPHAANLLEQVSKSLGARGWQVGIIKRFGFHLLALFGQHSLSSPEGQCRLVLSWHELQQQ